MKFVNKKIQEVLENNEALGSNIGPEAGLIFDAFVGPELGNESGFDREIGFYKGVDTIMDFLKEFSKKNEIVCESDVESFYRFVINRAEGVLYLRKQNENRT